MASPTSASSVPDSRSPSVGLIVLAFLSIYLIWGSTYLAIRFAIETMPPLLMAAVRFWIAGAVLVVWAKATNGVRATPAQWKSATICGTLLLLGGNGAVVIAEQWVPSGLVALLVASVPFWMVVLDARFGAKVRPSRRAVVGLLVGFAGVALLAGSPGVGQGGRQELIGAGVVLLGSASWAAGSIYARYTAHHVPARLWVGMQMVTGGTALFLVSVVVGEPWRFEPSEVSLRSGLALLYLIVFGAIIGYAAYIWLLKVVSPAKVATYAYVNPVVALLLGWGFAGEPLTTRSLFAGAVIIAAVVVISKERAPVVPARPLTGAVRA